MSHKRKLRIKHNPYAVKGAKVNAFSGGVISRKPLPDGRIFVTVTDEYGRKTKIIEQEVTNGHN